MVTSQASHQVGQHLGQHSAQAADAGSQDNSVFNWRTAPAYASERTAAPAADSTFERHYRLGELARLWAVGRETLRKIFKDEPGVVKIRIGKKKSHVTYSIPESVARRVHVRLAAAA